MTTLVIGAAGSMGKRYCSILKSLKQPYVGLDKESSFETIVGTAKMCERIILCTQTDLHGRFLRKLIPLSIPILCEKPIVKDTFELEKILELTEKHSTHFTMMFQYGELIKYPHKKSGPSSYNYFRTGNDGLIWDCLQIIALANDTIELKNESPIWKCKINGTSLKSSDMDYAYLSFVQKWIKNQHHQNLSDLYGFHKKTEDIYNASK